MRRAVLRAVEPRLHERERERQAMQERAERGEGGRGGRCPCCGGHHGYNDEWDEDDSAMWDYYQSPGNSPMGPPPFDLPYDDDSYGDDSDDYPGAYIRIGFGVFGGPPRAFMGRPPLRALDEIAAEIRGSTAEVRGEGGGGGCVRVCACECMPCVRE